MEVSKDFTPMLVLVPNRDLDLFTRLLEKFNLKIDKSDKEMAVAANDIFFEKSPSVAKKLEALDRIEGAFDHITATDEDIKSVIGLHKIGR